MGTAVGRQLLRRRRPLTATILSPDGSQVICRVRRPFYFINVGTPRSSQFPAASHRAVYGGLCNVVAHDT